MTSIVASSTTRTPPVDESLLFQIARGDKTALAELYTQTKAAVYGFALSIVKDPYGAEDVMQETYIRIFSAAGGYQAQGKPLAWILTIVRNLALMRLRQQKHDAPVGEQMEQRVASLAESDLDRLLLEAALQQLSDEESQIVILHSLTGFKHREIAALLELPLSTVLSKYRRALAKLREIMKEDEIDEPSRN